MNKNSPFILLFNFCSTLLNFQTFLYSFYSLFNNVSKTFENVSWLLYCLIWNVYYNITETSISVGRSKHDIFYFFGEKSQEVWSKCRLLFGTLVHVIYTQERWRWNDEYMNFIYRNHRMTLFTPLVSCTYMSLPIVTRLIHGSKMRT